MPMECSKKKPRFMGGAKGLSSVGYKTGEGTVDRPSEYSLSLSTRSILWVHAYMLAIFRVHDDSRGTLQPAMNACAVCSRFQYCLSDTPRLGAFCFALP